MSVDIYNSRRTNYHKCKYWKRDEHNINDEEELIHSVQPNGTFYAKDISTINKNSDDYGNIWKVDTEEIAIQTSDNVGDISKDDLVEFEKQIYRVTYVKFKHIHKRNEFGSTGNLITEISLRR